MDENIEISRWKQSLEDKTQGNGITQNTALSENWNDAAFKGGVVSKQSEVDVRQQANATHEPVAKHPQHILRT